MPGSYGLGGLNARSYVNGYGLLQAFTTGDTAHALQTGIVTLATLEALTGVIRLEGADGVRLLFARTSGATTLTHIISGFEPIIGPAGTPTYYVERVLSPVAATAMATSTVATGTALTTATNLAIVATTTPSVTTIPATALWVATFTALTGGQPCVGLFSPSSTGGVGHIEIGGMNGVAVATGTPSTTGGLTHIRVMLSCANAKDSVFCLAKRLRGQAGLYP